MHLADAFIQSDLQCILAIRFFISICVPWELNPQPFALLMQCSTTEPQKLWLINTHTLSHKCKQIPFFSVQQYFDLTTYCLCCCSSTHPLIPSTHTHNGIKMNKSAETTASGRTSRKRRAAVFILPPSQGSATAPTFPSTVSSLGSVH